MIYGIGTDIVRVARMQTNLERHGEKFAARILSESELLDYRQNARPANFLARRFAAKEAAAKALGTGIAEGIYLRDISVAHDKLGKPKLVFTGLALAFVQAQGIHTVHLSISDEEDYALAFVVLEREPT